MSIPVGHDPSFTEKNLSITEAKRHLRRQMLEKAKSLDPASAAIADAWIRSLLLSTDEYNAADTVFCFVGTETEINTAPFLEQALWDGKTVAVPLCIGKRIMQARQIVSLSDLKPGYYGIPEPDPLSSPFVDPSRIGLAVIPCVSCGHDGSRLGHGGGFYDVFFQEHPQIPTIMICREALTCETIPTQAHDLFFRIVITEKGIFRSE